jgi:hypothetical protein
MIDSLFHKLYSISIDNGLNHIKVPSLCLEIDKIIGLLNEIELNYGDDFEKHKNILAAGVCPLEREKGGIERFIQREIWRIGSYILFLCDLNKILDERYQVMKNLVKQLTRHKLKDSKDQRPLRREEMRKYKIYRGKIFAHTAFGSPEYYIDNKKHEESLSTRYTSLSYLSGCDIGLCDQGIVLGSSSLIVGGEPSAEFPTIKFISLTQDAAQNIGSWWSMYQSVMDLVKETSDEQIIKKQPNIKNIVRKP